MKRWIIIYKSEKDRGKIEFTILALGDDNKAINLTLSHSHKSKEVYAFFEINNRHESDSF